MMKYIKAVWKAWRPFSLTAAVIPTTLGSVLALKDGHFDLITFILVTICGLLLQSGVNLVNDFFEFKSGILPEKNPQLKLAFRNRMFFEYIIFLMGLGCFSLTVPLGLYLVYKSGIQLLVLGIVGFIGGYCYTGKPFSYKDKALGVVFVFFLMGVFMVYGTYYAFTARFSWEAVIVSLPISFLTSLLLISNEIRDIDNDTEVGLKTLSVIIGYEKAKFMYLMVLLVPYLLVPVMVALKLLPLWAFITYLSFPYGYRTYKMLALPLPERRVTVPRTANVHFMFGGLLIVGMLVGILL